VLSLRLKGYHYAGDPLQAAVAVESVSVVLFGGGELVEDEKHPKAGKDSDVVDVWSAAEKRWLKPLQLSA
jgi:hypothetical protein